MKKAVSILLALVFVVMAFAGCSSGAPKDPSQVKGETYDAGNVKALVPTGWAAFPVKDMWSEDPDAKDPDQIQICKDGEDEFDLFLKPYVGIVCYGPDTDMMVPAMELYTDAEELQPLTIGGKTWNGFKATMGGQPLTILWTGENGENQYQVTLWTETDEGKIQLEDADVQAILASIQS